MLIINYHHLLWTEIRTLFCKSPVACGCGCSLPCFPDLLLVLRLCSLWRDHWVRWSSMEKTVCVLSWLKLEALSCSRNNRGSPSFRTAMISSFTYRTQTEALFRAFHWQYYCFFTKEKNYTDRFPSKINGMSFSTEFEFVPLAAPPECIQSAHRPKCGAAGRWSLCNHALWWNYSSWTLCQQAHV